jgi:hypothetical protein
MFDVMVIAFRHVAIPIVTRLVPAVIVGKSASRRATSICFWSSSLLVDLGKRVDTTQGQRGIEILYNLARRDQIEIRAKRVSCFPVPALSTSRFVPKRLSGVVLNLGRSNVGVSAANPVFEAPTDELNAPCASASHLQWRVRHEHPAEPC